MDREPETVGLAGEEGSDNSGDGCPESGPQLVLRIAAGAAGLAFSGFAMLASWNHLKGDGFTPLAVVFVSFLAVLAMLCGWFALAADHPKSRARMRAAVFGGIIVAAIGLGAGFVGSMILAPGANDGPLLGIFFTGPVGFILGVPVGLLVHAIMLSRRSLDQGSEW